MRTLILMRHAKSSWDLPRPDHDRPLAKRGRRSARAMGNWLREIGCVPEAALSSTARRTMETFEGLALGCPVHFTCDLYHAEASAMRDVLQQASAPILLMLGHNPGIADFAHRVLSAPPDHPRFHDYPTCATLIARFDIANWAEVAWGSGTATDFEIPREILADKD